MLANQLLSQILYEQNIQVDNLWNNQNQFSNVSTEEIESMCAI